MNVTEEIYQKVDEAILDLISKLPCELKHIAENQVSCILDERDIFPEGIVLGKYVALTHGPIIIYVGTILEQEYGNLENALKSIKQVYLHELGHHLGLDEFELDIRGL